MPEPQHIDLPGEAVEAAIATAKEIHRQGLGPINIGVAVLRKTTPSIRQQERERFREAIYQELTHRYMPDHELIRHLDAAEAALDDQEDPDDAT